MAGLILPFNGLIKGGAKKVTLISHTAADQDTLGRVGDDPAPFTTGFSPTAAQFVVGGLAARVGTMVSASARHTACGINDESDFGIPATQVADDQGKNDDGWGISMAATSGPLTPPVTLEGRSPDFSSQVDRFGYAAGLFKGVGSILDADASTSSLSLTLNIAPDGYVFALCLVKNHIGVAWTNITELDELTVGGTDTFSYAGIETTTSGTLTISYDGGSTVQSIAAVSLQP